jgi:L-threonylcarbamoyladenylate synthase
MKTEVIKATHPVAMHHAVDVLHHGGLVVFPTDTVYGLAVLPSSEEFIERLYIVKGRDSTRAIAVLISNIKELDKVSEAPGELAHNLAEKFWPGPLTIVINRHPDLPNSLSPNQTIGVRIPDHPVALRLLQLTGPLAVTSANLSGLENTHTAKDALAQLDGRVHLIIDGGISPGGIPSTVVDCTTPDLVILRQGPILEPDLHAAIYSK